MNCSIRIIESERSSFVPVALHIALRENDWRTVNLKLMIMLLIALTRFKFLRLVIQTSRVTVSCQGTVNHWVPQAW